MPERIENENDDDDEEDCSKDRAMLKVVREAPPEPGSARRSRASGDPGYALVVTFVRRETGLTGPTQPMLCYFALSRCCAGCVSRATFDVAENGTSK
jgi:hypothetical protein